LLPGVSGLGLEWGVDHGVDVLPLVGLGLLVGEYPEVRLPSGTNGLGEGLLEGEAPEV
jgi:hypothetical protein